MARLGTVKTMESKVESRRFAEVLDAVRERIAKLDYVCTGSVAARVKQCGKPNCACAHDPEAKHGPYHVWTRHEEGRVLQTTLTEETAQSFKEAIANYRELQDAVATWIRESKRELLARDET